MDGLLAVASWVTWASPGAEKRRRIWIGVERTLNPGFERAGAGSEGEVQESDGSETETQGQDFHRLWVAGRRRG